MTKARAATIHLSFGGIGTFPSSMEAFNQYSSVKLATTARILRWHLGGDDRSLLYSKNGQLHGDDDTLNHQHLHTQSSRGRTTKIVIFQQLVANNSHLIEVILRLDGGV
jgi:hypothetical protein